MHFIYTLYYLDIYLKIQFYGNISEILHRSVCAIVSGLDSTLSVLHRSGVTVADLASPEAGNVRM